VQGKADASDGGKMEKAVGGACEVSYGVRDDGSQILQAVSPSMAFGRGQGSLSQRIV